MREAMLPDELSTSNACLISPTKSQLQPLLHFQRPMSLSTADVRRTLLRVNVTTAAGPDNNPGHLLRTCVNQLSLLTSLIYRSVSCNNIQICFGLKLQINTYICRFLLHLFITRNNCCASEIHL